MHAHHMSLRDYASAIQLHQIIKHNSATARAWASVNYGTARPVTSVNYGSAQPMAVFGCPYRQS